MKTDSGSHPYRKILWPKTFGYFAAMVFLTGDLLLAGDPTPSENANRMGQYTVQSERKGSNYHVYVPENYSAEKPAGILVHVCGTGSSADNSNFSYTKHLLEEYNLIGIHMAYEDGRPSVNSEEKIEASEAAIAQIKADYKIIPGRGIISSFSEGGIWHVRFWEKYSDGAKGDWPFSHHQFLSSNWTGRPKDAHSMSWYFCPGNPVKKNPDNAFSHLKPVADIILEKSPTCYFRVPIDKGHQYTKQDAIESGVIFSRTDLVCFGSAENGTSAHCRGRCRRLSFEAVEQEVTS